LAEKMRKASEESYSGGSGSPPSVISDVVVEAMAARRPRTRYAAGAMAKPLIFLRWLVSDRIFDRLVMSQVS